MVTLLNRLTMPPGLHPLFVVGAAVFIYSATTLIDGSGFLAVYIAGLVMANRSVRAYPSIVGFHDAASWLSQIVMFTMLGLLVTPSTLVGYALPGIGIALVLIFIARPAAVWLCLHAFGFTMNEKHFVSWVGLRGAVSIFLAAIPTLAGVPNAEIFFNTAFFVVLVSLLVQGWTLAPVARRLGMASHRGGPGAKRVEVDIPGQLEQEMVGYPIQEGSMILSLARMPTWLRIVMVVRDKEILGAQEASALRAGDYVYLLARPERVIRLDRLFEPSADPVGSGGPVFGEFPIHGEAMMRDVCAAYDLNVMAEERTLNVAGFIAGRLKGGVKLGARVPMRRATLVVRAAENGRVTEAGLQLDELMAALVVRARARKGGPLAAVLEKTAAFWRGRRG
jgi:cell volume regulation protein A